VEKRPLGRSGVEVSAITLGTMNFGADWHGVGCLGEKEARDLVDLALERGVNSFDTADIYGYGASEALLGKILKKRRSKLVIATKVLGQMRKGDPSSGGLSRDHITKGLDESLKRLGTDYVDLYMPHGWDPGVPLEESLEAFDRAVKAGKIRVLGCSNFEGDQLNRALGASAAGRLTRFEFDQVQYSLTARWAEDDLVPVCRPSQVSVTAWSPLGGGFLTGKYSGKERAAGRRKDPEKAFPHVPEEHYAALIGVLDQVAKLEGCDKAQAALGWVLSKPYVATAVVGARTKEQLAANLEAKPLSARAVEFLDRASALCARRGSRP
jgi:aryl-alcohol dehydrogenase-like predicted oxidoreductase